MKDWSVKNDNDFTIETGSSTASDFKSLSRETENVVKPFMDLDETDDKQLVKSVDILAKRMSYRDIGTVDNIVLKRINGVTEDYRTGATVLFKPKFTNTGPTNISFEGLAIKHCVVNATPLPAGYLNPNYVYIGMFDSPNDNFEIRPITVVIDSNDPNAPFQAADGVDPKDAVNVGQTLEYVKIVDIIDSLVSTDATKPLSANQGKILQGLIDTLEALVSSDDVNLDTLQEIVDYIKANRAKLDNLTIADFSGLQAALDGKASNSHNHYDLYAKKNDMDSVLPTKALKGGSDSIVFKVADAVDDDDIVNKGQASNVGGSTTFDNVETTDPLVTTNPSEIGTSWLNKTTGEIFICTNKTVNANVWKGTNGTVVEPDPIDMVDFFGDNSGLSLHVFDTDFKDYNNTYNGTTLNGAVITTDESRYGVGSLACLSGGQSVDIAYPSAIVKTISMWVKHRSSNDVNSYILDTKIGGTDYYFVIAHASLTYSFASGITVYKDGVALGDGSAYVADDKWHHYVVQYTTLASRITLGNIQDTASQVNVMDGWIDHVRVFNRALVASEVTALYNEYPIYNPVDFFKDGSGISLYEFEGDFSDTGGNYDAVSREGFSTSTSASKYGLGSLSIPSDSRHLDINTGSKTIRTISMWCNTVPFTHDYPFFFHGSPYAYIDNTGSPVYKIALITMYRDGIQINDGDAYVADDGVWHHYIFIIDTGSVMTSFTVGNHSGATNVTTRSGIGYYDQIRLFDKALTPTEIALLGTEVIPTTKVDIFKDGSGIAMYEFDGNFDDSNNLHDAVPINNTVTTTTSRYGIGSADFTTNGSGIKGADVTLNNIRTVSFWFRVITPSTTYNSLISYNPDQGPTVNHRYFLLTSNATEYTFNRCTVLVDGVAIANNQSFTNDNNWHHAIVTFDGLIDAFALGNLHISHSVDYNGNCYMDRVRVFNRELTSAETTKLLNEKPDAMDIDIFKDDSAISLYPFDGDFDDAGRNHNATPLNSLTTTTAESRYGGQSAGYFDGSKAIEADVPTNTVKTISMWVKHNGLPPEYAYVMDARRTSGSTSYFAIGHSSAPKYDFDTCTLYRDGVAVTNQSTYTGDTNWHHYVIVFDTPVSKITFGNYSGGPSANYALTGWVDHVRYFNRVLTADEIEKLSLEIVNINTVDALEDGSALGLFQFDTNLNDLSGSLGATEIGTTAVTQTTSRFGTGSLSLVSDTEIRGVDIDIGGTSARTVTFWTKFDHQSTTYNSYVSYNPNIGDSNYHRYHGINDANQKYLEMRCNVLIDGTLAISHDVTPALMDNEWHFVVMEFDTNVPTFTIGNIESNNNKNFNGNCYIDQFRVFNKVLTQNEIEIIMNETEV